MFINHAISYRVNLDVRPSPIGVTLFWWHQPCPLMMALALRNPQKNKLGVDYFVINNEGQILGCLSKVKIGDSPFSSQSLWQLKKHLMEKSWVYQ